MLLKKTTYDYVVDVKIDLSFNKLGFQFDF